MAVVIVGRGVAGLEALLGLRAMAGDLVRLTLAAPAHAGVEFKTGVVAGRDKDGLVLGPGGERVEAQRVFAVPRLLGPAVDGLPADEEGSILASDDARVQGCDRTWAAGDAVVSPLKFGGLATHQARRAEASIARLAGVQDPPDPGEPVIHGASWPAAARAASEAAATLRAPTRRSPRWAATCARPVSAERARRRLRRPR